MSHAKQTQTLKHSPTPQKSQISPQAIKQKFSLSNIINTRRRFLKENITTDHVVKTTNSCILISAPHGVTQIREGKPKYAEIGSLTAALFLSHTCQTNFIAKTKTNNDDANYDLSSPYKESIKNLVKNSYIKYVLDFHGLAKFRPMHINLAQTMAKI